MTANPGLGGQSDRDLVLAFQAGDRAAYDELYRRHRDRVARVCYRFLNSGPDAEEAAQETFLKAYQALPRFNGQYQVGAWLARIAANVCVDHLRVKSRTHLVALPNEDRVLILEPGPEDLLVGEYPNLDVAISEIQPLHANALKMRGLEGMSHVEMAGRLDMSPSQVKALLHRARSSFKRAWNKAQGWMLAPLVGTRSLDRSPNVSQASSNLAVVSAHAPALAERAAASVLIVMVALSGPMATPTSPKSEVSAPSSVGQRSPKRTHATRAAIRKERSPVAATRAVGDQEATEADGLVLGLPQTLTSTIEGGNETVGARENGGGSDHENEDGLVPTVKESPKGAQEIIEDAVDELENDPAE